MRLPPAVNSSEKQHCDSHDDARHCHPGTEALSCSTHAEGLNLMLLLGAALFQDCHAKERTYPGSLPEEASEPAGCNKQMASETDCSWQC